MTEDEDDNKYGVWVEEENGVMRPITEEEYELAHADALERFANGDKSAHPLQKLYRNVWRDGKEVIIRVEGMTKEELLKEAERRRAIARGTPSEIAN